MRRLILILSLICIISACQKPSEAVINIHGVTMGTTYSVKMLTPKNSQKNGLDKDNIHADIENILNDINQTMSTYIADSELSLINQGNVSDWQAISDDLYDVIEHANTISAISNGAFDVTVGPLVNIWGFGPDPFTQEIPDESSIQAAKQHTGFEKILFDRSSKRISKSHPKLYIDLSGIAKGFAVDKIALYLDKNYFQDYLIEIGGELLGKGLNANHVAWQIGIEQATPLERTVQRIVDLKNMAMATSGDYRNYFEKEGVRYSHTINPNTGTPIKHNLASVTVLDKSAMHADALATAFMVMGTEKAHALANELGIAVYTLSKTNTGFDEKYNNYFKPYLSDK